MTLFDILVLALVQGLTEFLPVSSSGHLVLANAFLGVREPGIVAEIVLHLGTLLAVVLYFRKDLVQLIAGVVRSLAGGRGEEDRAASRLLAALVIGTVPAVIVGLAGGGWLESLYENPREASIEILITAAILLSTLFVRRGTKAINTWRAGVIGLFQAVALLPGISRSGTTISGGIYLGVRPEEAARFSFLLSIPAILGAAVLKLPEVVTKARTAEGGLLVIGFLVSFAVGYLSIAALLRIVRGGRFGLFGLYCILIGAAGLLLLHAPRR